VEIEPRSTNYEADAQPLEHAPVASITGNLHAVYSVISSRQSKKIGGTKFDNLKNGLSVMKELSNAFIL